MTTKASIILPCYNVEKYIARSIESVLAQSYLGIDHAEGEWITFVDSDDQLIENYIENLLIDIQNSDFVFQGIIRKKLNGQEEVFMEYKDSLISIKDFLINYAITSSGYLFGKIYKTTIIRNFKIKFIENLQFAEDALFLLDYLCYVETIMLSSKKGYIYHEVSNSLVKQKYAYNKEIELLENAKEKMLRIFHKHNLSSDNSVFYKEFQYYMYRILLSTMSIDDRLQRENIFSFLLSKFYFEFLECYRSSKGRGKIAFILITFRNPTLLDYYFRNILFKPIDYSSVNKKIDNLKRSSIEFLVNNL